MGESRKTVDREKFFKRLKIALAVILPLCVLSLLIAALVCSVANDMYAFVKREREITLNIDCPRSLEEFSKMLGDANAVYNPHVFMLYVKSKNKTELVEHFVGELNINENMSYREILLALS